MASGSRQRPHRPHELGPRLFRRGSWWAADLRPWEGGRVTLRDPDAVGWPDAGQRTRERAAADRWRWSYVEHLEELARRARLGLPPLRRFRTLGEARDRYLRHRETAVEPNTVASDRTVLMHLIEFAGAGAPIAALRPAMLQELVDRRLREGYAPTTVDGIARTLATFAKWVGVPHLLEGVVLPKPGRQDTRTWEADELDRIRKAADDLDRDRRSDSPSARLSVELAVATGARLGELFAMEWECFDDGRRTVRIHRQLVEDRKRFKPLKGKSGRTAVVLPGWWEYHQADAPGLVLPGRNGGPFTAPRRLIGRLLDGAGVNGPGLGWHSFRHTYARRFVEMGGRLEELQKSLGHASIRTTERSYGHLREDVAAGHAVAAIYGRPQLRVVNGGGG